MRAALLLGALLAGIRPAASGQEASSVFAGADPDMEAAEGRYWIYPTGGGMLAAWSSPDRVAWTRGETLLRLADIGWIDDDRAPRHHLWAPDMVRARGGWYLYYSVGPQNPTPSRIGVAVCKGPAGPCTDSGKPLITGGEGFEAIDPAVFVDPKSATPYLYAGGSAGATLRAWVLRPDMLGVEREVRVETPPGFTEGAFMHYRDGVYYLSIICPGRRGGGTLPPTRSIMPWRPRRPARGAMPDRCSLATGAIAAPATMPSSRTRRTVLGTSLIIAGKGRKATAPIAASAASRSSRSGCDERKGRRGMATAPHSFRLATGSRTRSSRRGWHCRSPSRRRGAP